MRDDSADPRADERRRVLPTDWQRVPMPPRPLTLRCDQRFTFEQFEQLKMGVFPREIEEKWFICWQEPWLHAHRSWTGYEVYALRFDMDYEGARAIELHVNGDREQFAPDEDADHVADVLELLAVLFGGAGVESGSGAEAIAAWARFGNAALGWQPELGVRPSEVGTGHDREA